MLPILYRASKSSSNQMWGNLFVLLLADYIRLYYQALSQP